MEYLGTELASNALSDTEAAMAAVTLFVSSIVSLKFNVAYASGISEITQPFIAAVLTFAPERRKNKCSLEKICDRIGRQNVCARYEE